MGSNIAHIRNRRRPTAQERREWISGLNHGQRQRLRFLESRLLWEGEVNRRDVCDKFGVTPNHFTREMRAYKENFPNNIWYDETHRSYRPSSDFQPSFASGNADEYLALLRVYSLHPSDTLRAELGSEVSCDSLPSPEGAVDKDVLRSILGAIHHKYGCIIRYQSFTHAKPENRSIWPHALTWTSDRWNVRAYDERRARHIDLGLTRISSIRDAETARPAAADEDPEWEQKEDIEVIPNPELSAGQQLVVAKEYGMTRRNKDWVWTVTLRRCLIPYFLYRFRLDEDRSNETREGFPLQRIILRDPTVRDRYAFRRD